MKPSLRLVFLKCIQVDTPSKFPIQIRLIFFLHQEKELVSSFRIILQKYPSAKFSILWLFDVSTISFELLSFLGQPNWLASFKGYSWTNTRGNRSWHPSDGLGASVSSLVWKMCDQFFIQGVKMSPFIRKSRCRKRPGTRVVETPPAGQFSTGASTRPRAETAGGGRKAGDGSLPWTKTAGPPVVDKTPACKRPGRAALPSAPEQTRRCRTVSVEGRARWLHRLLSKPSHMSHNQRHRRRPPALGTVPLSGSPV